MLSQNMYSSHIYKIGYLKLSFPKGKYSNLLPSFCQGSKLLGWQLCADVTYPVLLMGKGFPPPGPMIFSLRLQKLDRVLQKYLLEAAYAFVPQVGILRYLYL